ncbi:MAG TPA: prolyl oligopeptidase family serine peptidase [Candidatus Avisuccinivibrio pullicola]|nr:prolyl oligopeptidase family serine peptidase [Candidatus Avisuccinivibrio pullicola]
MISRDAPAVLTIHGSDDGIVPVEQAQLLHATLKEKGVKEHLRIIEGGHHAGFAPTQYAEAYDAVFAFLKELKQRP